MSFALKPKTQMLRIQKVSDVEMANTPLLESRHRTVLEKTLRGPVEDCSYRSEMVVCAPFHPFVGALHLSFSGHRPLVLSPDMFWLLILQGLAYLIRENPEEYRDFFVSHDGKKVLTVFREDLVKGLPDNPWPEVFEEFSRQIKREIGEGNHSRIITNFSTTGPVEKAAFEVALMDSMQKFFDYEVSACGIPEVWLEGEIEDWRHLRDKSQMLGESYDLEWWTRPIKETLDRIYRNALGEKDPDLWKDIYKYKSGSGGPFVSGWVIDFFPEFNPYLNGNDACVRPLVNGRVRVTTDELPPGISLVPFKWNTMTGLAYEMEFIAGFTSVSQDSETMAVRPRIGWAVKEKQVEGPETVTDTISSLPSLGMIVRENTSFLARLELERRGVKESDEIPVLISILMNDQDVELREGIIWRLMQEEGIENSFEISQLIDLLESISYRISSFALRQIRRLGPNAREAIPFLIKRVAKVSSNDSWSIGKTLEAIDPQSIHLLIDFIKGGNSGERIRGLEALKSFESKEESVADQLEGLLLDPDEDVRKIADSILKRYKPINLDPEVLAMLRRAGLYPDLDDDSTKPTRLRMLGEESEPSLEATDIDQEPEPY